MALEINKFGLVGADPGPSTSDQGHSTGADPGPVLSGDQGHSRGAYPGPLLSDDQGLGKDETGVTRLRVGSANVGTLHGRTGEIVEMVGRRNLDVCCLQETRWKGGNTRTFVVDGARYKLYWSGCDRGLGGVGVMVSEKWFEHVVGVSRVNERLLCLRLAVGKIVLNVVSVYAPQVGRPMEEKEEFLAELRKLISGISKDEELVVCGDFNSHVGTLADGFENVHGGRGFGTRNTEGEMLLEFAIATELCVVNTWFTKEESKKVTYESGGTRTVVDYVLVRRKVLSAVKDMKVIRGEACLTQHKLLVCVLDVKACLKRKRKAFVNRRRVWRLKDAKTKQAFQDIIKENKSKREGDVDDLWNELKSTLLDATERVCGRTKGPARHKETWWWNDEVSEAIAVKRKAFIAWKRSKSEADKDVYNKANKDAKRVVAAAQQSKRQELSENLKTAEGKGKLFGVVKQMLRKNRDVVGSACIRNKEQKVLTDENEIKEVWKDYFEKLLNEEFEWDQGSLEQADAVSGPCENISVEEVRSALASSKSGKAAGPSEVVVEMLEASGEAGLQWVTDICNEVVRSGKIPTDWRNSWIVSVYKGKGDALECGSYRGIKLLDQVMKVFERVIEKKVRDKVELDEMQFGFRAGRGTTDAIFVVRQMQERFLEKGKDLWMAFVDLEKAFDRVPREVLWWALRSAGVDEWIVDVIRAMYCDVSTSVKLQGCESSEFGVKVGVHQGSVLSPLLFIIVLDELSKKFRVGLPWELLYADDLALLAETEEELITKIKHWKDGMEMKGLRVNMTKTKVLRCQKKKEVQVEDSSKDPCGVCKKRVGKNSICCGSCGKWIHKRCSGIKGMLKEDPNFKCSTCISGGQNRLYEKRELVLGPESSLEIVDNFCYLGDVIGAGGGAEEATRARTRCAWAKFRELEPILASRGASLKIKGKIYRACVRSVMVYGSETWAMRVEDMNRLERTERMMVRWMCGVTLKDKKCNMELLDRLGLESIAEVVRKNRLRWFGHVERMDAENYVSACREIEVAGSRGRGRGRKKWKECVDDDMRRLGLKKETAQDRAVWRSAIVGKQSDPRKRGKNRL
jgi:hypothetical protein